TARSRDRSRNRPSRAHHSVRERRKLLGPGRRDQEVVLESEAAAPVPVDARLDREHHAVLDLPAAGLLRIRRLVGPGADAVADGMARLALISGCREAVPDQAVELGQAGAGSAVRHRPRVDVEKLSQELLVARVELAGTDVLGVVAPVAVR